MRGLGSSSTMLDPEEYYDDYGEEEKEDEEENENKHSNTNIH